MLLTIILSFVCVCVAYVLVCRHYVPATNELIPSYPKKLPIIGHVHLLVRVDVIHETAVAIGRFALNNGGVCKVFIGPIPLYIVTDPDDVSAVLNRCLDKMFVYRFIEPMVGKMLIAAEVSIWKRNRRILDLGFKQYLLDDYLELFSNQADHLVQSMAEEVGKGEVDLTGKLTRSILETTCRTTLGTKVDGKDLVEDNYVKAVNEFLEILTVRFLKPWLISDFIFNLTSYKTKMSKALETILSLSDQMVRLRKLEHLRRLKNNQDFDYKVSKFRSLLDILVENSVTETSSLFTDVELRNIVDNVLLAAFDTTIYELLFLLVCIGSFPDAQEKIYQEITHVLGEDGRVTKNNISQLVYLDAAIKESVRLYPIALAIGRKATTEIKLRNATIPAGSSIALHIWAVNRNTEYWGADADDFKPERWLNPTTLPDHPAAYSSFAPGRRGCIGKTYALMYFKATLVPILRKFKLTADHTKMKLDCKIMIKPISGHHVKIEARQLNNKE